MKVIDERGLIKKLGMPATTRTLNTYMKNVWETLTTIYTSRWNKLSKSDFIKIYKKVNKLKDATDAQKAGYFVIEVRLLNSKYNSKLLQSDEMKTLISASDDTMTILVSQVLTKIRTLKNNLTTISAQLANKMEQWERTSFKAFVNQIKNVKSTVDETVNMLKNAETALIQPKNAPLALELNNQITVTETNIKNGLIELVKGKYIESSIVKPLQGQ